MLVIEVTPELHFYAQLVEQGPKLEQLMTKIRQEFVANPPLPGAYTPKRGDMCAAKFVDDQWYRARIEKVSGSKVSVFYVDYGNRETLDSTRCAALPSSFQTDKPYAHEYGLACAQLPKDASIHYKNLFKFAKGKPEKVKRQNERREKHLPDSCLQTADRCCSFPSYLATYSVILPSQVFLLHWSTSNGKISKNKIYILT